MTAPDSRSLSELTIDEMAGLLDEQIGQNDRLADSYSETNVEVSSAYRATARVLRAIKQRLEAGEALRERIAVWERERSDILALSVRLAAAETRVRELTTARDAWRDLAEHLSHCAECCEMSSETCDDNVRGLGGRSLRLAAEATDSPAAPSPTVDPEERQDMSDTLDARMRLAVATLAVAVEGEDYNGTLAEWFRVGYLREVADIIDEARKALAAPSGERLRDSERLDWLEGEADRERRTLGDSPSMFRRNQPITRAAIDEAIAAEAEAKLYQGLFRDSEDELDRTREGVDELARARTDAEVRAAASETRVRELTERLAAARRVFTEAVERARDQKAIYDGGEIITVQIAMTRELFDDLAAAPSPTVEAHRNI